MVMDKMKRDVGERRERKRGTRGMEGEGGFCLLEAKRYQAGRTDA